jgi:hypothetical protein
MWRAADICVLETDLPSGQYGTAEEFREKLIEKVREYVFLYDTGHPEFRASTTGSFFFYKSVLTEEVLPRRNWTS